MPTRSRLRRLAAYVLLVWLLALASGFANACIVAAELRQAGHAAAAEDSHSHHLSGMADTARSHDQGHASKRPCERLCQQHAVATAHMQQSSAVEGLFFVAAPPPFRSQAVADPVVPGAAADPSWRMPVPIAIAYVRLTL